MQPTARFVSAEIRSDHPDQITRNAPRDLPSFEQKYQMHIGVLGASNRRVEPTTRLLKGGGIAGRVPERGTK